MFIKGKQAAQTLNTQKQKDAGRSTSRNSDSAPRFWLDAGKSDFITFVDGALIEEDGEQVLDLNCFYEHHGMMKSGYLKIGDVEYERGYYDLPCIQNYEGQSCPICETEGKSPVLSAAFTVITEWKKNGETKYGRKLYVARTTGVIDTLVRMASRRGGLVGCRFEVFRKDKRSPRCGDTFDFIDKGDPQELRRKFFYEKDGKKYTLFKPLDYTKAIVTFKEVQLIEAGFGSGAIPQSAAANSFSQNTAEMDDVDDML